MALGWIWDGEMHGEWYINWKDGPWAWPSFLDLRASAVSSVVGGRICVGMEAV